MKTLAIDDLSVGMIVTGLGRKYQSDVHSEYGYMGLPAGPVIGTVEKQDNSYMGTLYRVEAIDLPMIVIREVCSRYGNRPAPGSWDDKGRAVDTREYRNWAQPSRKYIEALCPALIEALNNTERSNAQATQ